MSPEKALDLAADIATFIGGVPGFILRTGIKAARTVVGELRGRERAQLERLVHDRAVGLAAGRAAHEAASKAGPRR